MQLAKAEFRQFYFERHPLDIAFDIMGPWTLLFIYGSFRY